MILRGVGMICPQGKHHSENFQKSRKIKKCKQFSEMFGFGTISDISDVMFKAIAGHGVKAVI